MFNLIIEKLVTHFLLARLANPLAKLHALLIGHRTDICLLGWGLTYILQYGAIITQEQAEHARNIFIGAGGLAMMDKFTRYSNIANVLIVKAKALEEEKKDSGKPPTGNP